MKTKLFPLIGAALFMAAITNATEFYGAKELSIDLGAQYQVGKDSSDLFNSTLKGGDYAYTLGVNYFVTRYIGIGGDIHMLEPEANQDHGSPAIAAANLNLLVRYPFGRVAPYAIAGAGHDWAFGEYTLTAGAGVEVRVSNGLGVFGEVRRNFIQHEQDLVQFRLGFRVSRWPGARVSDPDTSGVWPPGGTEWKGQPPAKAR